MGVGVANLPREIAPSVFWLGDCTIARGLGESLTHVYQSVYVIEGEERSLIVDTGIAKDWREIERQLDELIEGGLAPVSYLFPSHPEMAHAANLGRLLTKFPDSIVYSVVPDYHLVFPEFADRFIGTEVGDEIDLGGRTLVTVEAIFRDIVSQWVYDPVARTLFTGDGFAYRHHHDVGECGKCAEEIPGLPLPELTATFSEAAFYWTRFCDIEPIITQLEDLFDTLEIDVVAPGHGCPILDPPATLPSVMEGLRLGQTVDRATLGRRLDEYVTATYGHG